ncbi:fimbria/pilus outer membrane usher protein [Providencia sp. JUb39]|uniref:fimbria/pilus outer membrane usher protein n=1 Tax=Providencia sp. JUb39 TaxID=2724165 RepID=UPI00164DB9D1|nr:fimbria/pilus outer membrane usher protein [Providencia sp. JUb39]MBC5791438.1 fimbrial biogenesis outer membrane usher protein [Providencia sp. JUb39]
MNLTRIKGRRRLLLFVKINARRVPQKYAIWLIGTLFFNYPLIAADGFDIKTLENLGYSADIANFFNESRFIPGLYPINIEINAADSYHTDARFGANGELCVDEQLLNTLNLKTDIPLSECTQMTQLWPEAIETLSPGTFSVYLTLPEQAFDTEKRQGNISEGYAALLNYDVFHNQVRGHYGQQNTLQATLEPAINIKNWVIRNRSYYSKDESRSRLTIQETSGTRDLASLSSSVQIGEFGALGSINGGVPLTGAQIYSNAGMRDTARLAIPVQGMVQSQATVEVKQYGNVVYRTLLPAGPFSLTNLGQAIGGVEAEIIITESDGQQQKIIVTPSIGGNSSEATTYQIGAGRYRPYMSTGINELPILMLGEIALSPIQGKRITFGGLLSRNYQNFGLRGETNSSSGHWLSGDINYAKGKQNGIQANLQGQLSLTNNLSLALATHYRSKNHQTIDDAVMETSLDNNRNQVQQSHSISISWSTMALGAISYSQSINQYHGNTPRDHAQTLAFGRRFGSTTLSLNMQWSDNGNKTIYAGISFPLWGGSSNSRLQQQRNLSPTIGSSWQGNLGSQLYSSLDIARDSNGIHDISGSLSGNTPYSHLTAGLSHSGNGNKSMMLSSSGTMGIANNIWVTSPNQAGDTLAIVRIPGQPGVHVSGTGGDGITDFAGDALLTSVQPYQLQEAIINTQKLPLNLRLNSTSAEFKLARGSVKTQRFQASIVKQLLLTVRDKNGATLPVGASVHRTDGSLIGTLIGDGNVMLVNDDIGKPLTIRRINLPECQLSYQTPEAFLPDVLYEERDALCTEASSTNQEIPTQDSQ